MKFFIISTCLLITYVTLDIVFDKQLWEKNVAFATYLQDNQFYGELYLFKFFSLIIQLPIFVGVFQFMLSRKKIESILYLFLCIIGFVTNGLLKNAYHQPRPYWVESIQGLGCNMEFGKPSGHAQTSIIIYFSYLFIFYPITFKFTKARVFEQPSKEIPNWASTLLIILAFIAMFMTGLSRVYLGVHTFSQVLLGWMYGIYIVLNYQIYCHEFMLKYSFPIIQDISNYNQKHNQKTILNFKDYQYLQLDYLFLLLLQMYSYLNQIYMYSIWMKSNIGLLKSMNAKMKNINLQILMYYIMHVLYMEHFLHLYLHSYRDAFLVKEALIKNYSMNQSVRQLGNRSFGDCYSIYHQLFHCPFYQFKQISYTQLHFQFSSL